MDRRKFFKKLGLTAAVAAIAPKLLAEEAPVEDVYTEWFEFDYDGTTQGLAEVSGPYIHLMYDDKDTIKFPYKEAWKRPVLVAPGVTVMYLPRQLSWAKDMIIARDENEDFTNTIEVEGSRDDVYCMMVRNIEVSGFIGGPVEIKQNGKWLK